MPNPALSPVMLDTLRRIAAADGTITIERGGFAVVPGTPKETWNAVTQTVYALEKRGLLRRTYTRKEPWRDTYTLTDAGQSASGQPALSSLSSPAAERIRATRIDIADGIIEGENIWSRADDRLRELARELRDGACTPGTPVIFKVGFADGETYKGTYYLYAHQKDVQALLLAPHVRWEATVRGQRDPAWRELVEGYEIPGG